MAAEDKIWGPGSGRPADSLSDPPFVSLEDAARRLTHWLASAALPLWGGAGVDPANGGFREALTPEGLPHDPRRRTRVQARQAYVFATAAAEGVPGDWLATAKGGRAFLERFGRRPDGLFVNVVAADGAVLDETPRLYEHAFVLLALSALARAEPDAGGHVRDAAVLREAIGAFRHGEGGFREHDPQPFQANAHMHLLEAALAWETLGDDPAWGGLADEIAQLALDRFVDPETGLLREFFDADWTARQGEAGLIEPGHHFEWAWLLERWGRRRGDERARAQARTLYEIGRRGIDPVRRVAVNALWDDLTVRDAQARLWPQTERLKAALILGEHADALAAARAISAYLHTPAPGAWRERMRPDGGFVEEPAPATSLYHLTLAILELRAAAAGA